MTESNIQETVQMDGNSAGTFEVLLRSLLQETVTLVNSESYEEAPVGHRLCPAFHRGKLVGVGQDYIVLAAEYVHRGTGGSNGRPKEPVRSYIPIAKIKRISILKSERLIHI